jgi:hypothetical protein
MGNGFFKLVDVQKTYQEFEKDLDNLIVVKS